MKEKASDDKKGWKDLPLGCVWFDVGNAVEYKTGGWRTFKPVWHKDKCIQCLSCWIQCPDSSIQVADSKVTGIDYDHCKGCGICSDVCPVKDKAITMAKEH